MKCWAYDDNGTICGRPAVTIDEARGCAVCERHAPAQEVATPARTSQARGETGSER